MSNLVLKQNKELTLNSREVAEMVRKNHAHLLRDIRTYEEYISTNPDLDSLDFFIPSTYIDSKGEERANYQITKKGCEFIAHKLTGQKGTMFTATYINKFHQMEEALIAIHGGQPVMIKKDEDAKLFIQKQRAEAMLLNARTRQAKLILEMKKTGNLSPIAVELLGVNALEVLTDQPVDYRPEIEKTYTATEIAKELGVSATMVGRAANKLGLKSSEYGITVLDKSRYSNKQVSSFRYNEKGKQKIHEFFKQQKQNTAD